MNLSETITFESAAVPGVTVTIKRMGISRRSAVEMETVKIRRRLRELESEYPEKTEEETALEEQINVLRRKAASVSAEEMEAVVRDELVPKITLLASIVPQDKKIKRAAIDDEWLVTERQTRPAWLRAGLISVSGGKLEGMTAEQMAEFGPTELVDEIVTALVTSAKMTSADREGFVSPTTSGARAGGPTTDTSAPTAKTDISTDSETASSSSRAA